MSLLESGYDVWTVSQSSYMEAAGTNDDVCQNTGPTRKHKLRGAADECSGRCDYDTMPKVALKLGFGYHKARRMALYTSADRGIAELMDIHHESATLSWNCCLRPALLSQRTNPSSPWNVIDYDRLCN